MIYLLLSILCSALIGNLLTLFKTKSSINILQVFLGNYLVASIVSFFSIRSSFSSLRMLDYFFGIITGFFFLINFLIYQKNIHKNGLSLSVSIMRVSLIIPVTISIVFFLEKILVWNYFGIAIIVISFFILADTKKFHNFFCLLLLFLFTGSAESMLKLYEEFGIEDKTLYIFLVFASAFIINGGIILLKKQKFHFPSFRFGLLLGIPNQLTTKFLMLALQTVPGSIAFPVSASGVVVVVILTDLFIWRKRFTLPQRLALALLLAGITLINWK